MSEQITIKLTDQKEQVTVKLNEAARGPGGSDANVTNANVNLAISDDPAATRSALEIPINNFTASTAPTANDDETEGYSQGSKWYGGGEAYLCVDPTEGAAVWVKTTLTADELGDAAFKNTGSTAGTVAAGDDSRLSDARTPTAHASTHVTGGADKIRDASAAQDGLMTTAYAAKLDGIAANANNYTHPNHSGDVTSAGDGAQTIANNAVTFAKMQDVSSTILVGRHAGGSGDPQEVSVGNGVEFQGSGIRRSALTGDVTASAGSNTTTLQGAAVAARITEAAAKTTLVDADETALTDSAASFGLKKVTFANLFAYILTKIQAAASIVFTGQLRSTNQTAATGDALMTRDLGDARLLTIDAIRLTLVSTAWANTVVGSGSALTAGGASALRLVTGSTTGSSVLARANANSLLSIHKPDGTTAVGVIKWNQRFRVGFLTAHQNIDANTVFRFQIGELNSKTTVSDLDQRGVGIKITNAAIQILAHNGTDLTTSASVGSITAARLYRWIIDSDGLGNVSLYRNGTLLGSTTGGPTTASPNNHNAVNASVTNGAGTQITVADFNDEITILLD
jgi:hypothetical protein